jgi:sigma-E factor negative regulatory protein RseC
MENSASVVHAGIVERITGTKVRVRFVAYSACSACHAKGVCSPLNSEEKFIDLTNTLPGLLPGDHVEVILKQSQGFKAVWYGYGLPLIILLGVIFIFFGITGSEGLAALSGLASLLPYYLLVFLFRKRITRSMEFKLLRAK